MVIACAFMILSVIGTLGARQPDIDINRVKLLPRERVHHVSPNNFHSRRSIVDVRRYNRINDYDDHSRGVPQLRASLQLVHNTTSYAQTKAPLKIHQPREDPRLFYQSATYLEETNGKNINREVMSIYPGKEVVRAGDDHYRPSLHRIKKHELNDLSHGYKTCVRCPHDRTLIAKVGSNRVLLQHPRLLSCSGRKASRNVRFEHMYGPKFGSLLEQGSYTIIGRVTHKNQVLQTCKMQITVLIQFCPIPHYLLAHCGKDQNRTCNFSCRDSKLEVVGSSTLTCGDDMKWLGRLPACSVRTWCNPLPPPEHGRISCKGLTTENAWGFKEGSSCRLLCARGWRWSSRRPAICHRGAWTHDLICQPTRTK